MTAFCSRVIVILHVHKLSLGQSRLFPEHFVCAKHGAKFKTIFCCPVLSDIWEFITDALFRGCVHFLFPLAYRNPVLHHSIFPAPITCNHFLSHSDASYVLILEKRPLEILPSAEMA